MTGKAELSKELFGRKHWLTVAENVRQEYLDPPQDFRGHDVQAAVAEHGVGRTTAHELIRSMERLGMVARRDGRGSDGSVWLGCQPSPLWSVVQLALDTCSGVAEAAHDATSGAELAFDGGEAAGAVESRP